MKSLAESLIIAFSMYSALPMPQRDWRVGNMRLAMVCFPLVGLPVWGALWLWAWLCGALGLGNTLFAAVATAIPVVVTGGIHLDGFCDTTDALSAQQSVERRLEILKDPHIGAFGVMGCILYLVVTFGLYTALPAGMLPVVGVGFLLSRTLSALAVVSFPLAKNTGLARTFADGADKKQARLGLGLLLAGAALVLLWLHPLVGALVLLAASAVFVWYRSFSQRLFGGITGDLAGYFLQWCELAILATAVLGSSAVRYL